MRSPTPAPQPCRTRDAATKALPLAPQLDAILLFVLRRPPPPPRPAARRALAASSFRGVTLHRRSGRYEARAWLRGSQEYIGSWTAACCAARARDLLTLAMRGVGGWLNFPNCPAYADAGLLSALAGRSREEVVSSLRRCSRAMADSRLGSGAGSTERGPPPAPPPQPRHPASLIAPGRRELLLKPRVIRYGRVVVSAAPPQPRAHPPPLERSLAAGVVA
jgi:hypothetical protein